MCSICGGTKWDSLSKYIWKACQDRGRDSEGKYHHPSGSWLGNRRAIPTTELENPIEKQPVGKKIKIVFNGIISNDKALGIKEGEADTSILPRILNFKTLTSFRDSLKLLIGSYAIAAMKPNGIIWLAANYKPIWIAKNNGNFYFSSLEQHFPLDVKPYKIKPYSTSILGHYDSWDIPRVQSSKALVIGSSGLDSTVVASYVCNKHKPKNTMIIHFNYGCMAENKERECISKIAEYLQCGLDILPMISFGGSSLLSDNEDNISKGVVGAEYAHEWVPARNLMMLSHAVAYAEANGYGYIYLGTNLEEAGAYPDNEEQFILDFNNLLYGAVQNGVKIEIKTPLGSLMKHEIIPFGLKYKTPFNLTWSCYKGGEKHCGNCGPCFMRKTAFERNGLKDPVFEY